MAANGPPTREEMRTLYPPLFSFPQLKGFIASGLAGPPETPSESPLMIAHMYRDLSLLERHPDLQKRYEGFCNALKTQHGSVGKPCIGIRTGGLHLKLRQSNT